MEQTQPSKLKYIGAWFLAAFAGNILIKIVDSILANAMVNDVSDLNTYFVVGAAVSIPIVSGSFIFIYNLFKSLNIKKVMIYLYVLTPLGTFFNFGLTYPVYRSMGVDLTVYFWVAIITPIAALYLIRSYYIKRPDRWF